MSHSNGGGERSSRELRILRKIDGVGIGLVAGKTDLLEKTLTIGDWEQNRTASGRSSDQFSRLPSSETKHLGWLWILVEMAALNYVARMMNARLA